MRLQSWRRWKWQNQQRSLFVHFTLFSRRSEKSTNLKWENWGTIKVPWPLPDLTLPKMTFSEWCIPIVTLYFCKQKWPNTLAIFIIPFNENICICSLLVGIQFNEYICLSLIVLRHIWRPIIFVFKHLLNHNGISSINRKRQPSDEIWPFCWTKIDWTDRLSRLCNEIWLNQRINCRNSRAFFGSFKSNFIEVKPKCIRSFNVDWRQHFMKKYSISIEKERRGGRN